MPERSGGRDGKPAPALREDDPVMRKLRAKFSGRDLKGGLG
jgi:hypothetical protein